MQKEQYYCSGCCYLGSLLSVCALLGGLSPLRPLAQCPQLAWHCGAQLPSCHLPKPDLFIILSLRVREKSASLMPRWFPLPFKPLVKTSWFISEKEGSDRSNALNTKQNISFSFFPRGSVTLHHQESRINIIATSAVGGAPISPLEAKVGDEDVNSEWIPTRSLLNALCLQGELIEQTIHILRHLLMGFTEPLVSLKSIKNTPV